MSEIFFYNFINIIIQISNGVKVKTRFTTTNEVKPVEYCTRRLRAAGVTRPADPDARCSHITPHFSGASYPLYYEKSPYFYVRQIFKSADV